MFKGGNKFYDHTAMYMWKIINFCKFKSKIDNMYFGQGEGNAGDLSKIGKEKGKTKLVICIISVIVISMILASLFLDNS